MKVKQAKLIYIKSATLTRQAAEKLIKLVGNDPDFVTLVKNIIHQMQDIYTYKIRCCGCGHKIDYECYGTLTKKEITEKEEYFLCDPCYSSEDFK